METKRNDKSRGEGIQPKTNPSLEIDNKKMKDTQKNKKRNYPFRSYHTKEESGSNKRLWMELYPAPKRQSQQRAIDTQEPPQDDREVL